MDSNTFRTINIDPKSVILRQLQADDVTEQYVSWLNDPEIVRFLEIKNSQPITYLDTIEFVKNCELTCRHHWGIFVDGEHKGNISCSAYDPVHKWVNISNLIGDKEYQKTDLCKLSLAGAIDHLFSACDYHRIQAGTYSEHFPGIALLTNLGFRKEAILREAVIFEGKYIDSLRFGLLKREWLSKHRRPPTVHVCPPPWEI